MRTWGRNFDADGNPTWVKVETDARGFDDYVYITALIQCLKLNLNESPFWADFGIPARQSVLQQVAPDYNAQFIATYFSRFFASLIIARAPIDPPAGTARAQPQSQRNAKAENPGPTYYVQILRRDGSLFEATIGL